ncbi:uncharacterized protein LOC116426068 [Nomia melanderi]|uniref:uncharacterized protein LOC116426068 n=1 Tax=Nomia melanderi TaxID=2448451 RepID=UPI003FCD2F5A
MKRAYTLLTTCCLLVSCSAKPAGPLLNYQDSYGQYSFGYSAPNSARSEFKTLDGVIHGSYSYIDDAGVIQTAHYTADDMGFRITATNLPQAPVSLYYNQEAAATRKTREGTQEVTEPADEKTLERRIGENNVFLKPLLKVQNPFEEETLQEEKKGSPNDEMKPKTITSENEETGSNRKSTESTAEVKVSKANETEESSAETKDVKK